jgi:hypothetical protein
VRRIHAFQDHPLPQRRPSLIYEGEGPPMIPFESRNLHKINPVRVLLRVSE